MEAIFMQLAIILSVAFIVSYIIRLLKQPLIVAYIITGILISPFILKFGASTQVIDLFSKFGIAFLLFIVGLHLNPKVIKEIGTASLFVGLGQIIITFGVGFLVAQLLGYSIVASSYIGIALSFSSTIIVMKLLSDKQHLDSLSGKISTGILIIQDLVAIGVLMFISSGMSGFNSPLALRAVLAGAGTIVLLFLIGFYILPKLTRNIAKNQELLFLFSIFWCFIISALFGYLGFSIEIGALIAGIVLAISPYSVEISSKIRPLRDFFLILFFIILGLNIHINHLGGIIVNALIFSAIVLIIKPIIIMGLLAIFKYTKRTNFLVGTTLAQISEFSLIILMLGVSKGIISANLLYTLTLSLVITIFFSTYMIMYSRKFYTRFYKFASLFERKKAIKREKRLKNRYEAVLFGYNRIGFSILKALKKIKEKYIVVDFNPDTIASLSKFNIPCLYGDVDDPELLRALSLRKIKLAISTIPDFETNVLLLETIRAVNKDAIFIGRAHTIQDALDLYSAGATYVLTPHFLGGEYVAKMIKNLGASKEEYGEEKTKHIKMLKEILSKEQDHPSEKD